MALGCLANPLPFWPLGHELNVWPGSSRASDLSAAHGPHKTRVMQRPGQKRVIRFLWSSWLPFLNGFSFTRNRIGGVGGCDHNRNSLISTYNDLVDKIEKEMNNGHLEISSLTRTLYTGFLNWYSVLFTTITNMYLSTSSTKNIYGRS